MKKQFPQVNQLNPVLSSNNRTLKYFKDTETHTSTFPEVLF